MKAKPETWTVVLAGGWNVRVFSPDWVGRHLIAEKPLNLEVPLAAPIQHLKFTGGGLVLIPADDRLIVGVQEATLQAMRKAEDVAKKAAAMLPHTPTAAVGVNLGFEDENPSARLTEVFRVSDLSALSSFGCEVSQTTIVRRLLVEGAVVNLTHTFVDGKVQVHFNFHHDATSADQIATVLTARTEACFAIATRLLSEVYDSTIESEV